MKNSLESKLQTDFKCFIRIFYILEFIARKSFFKYRQMLNPASGYVGCLGAMTVGEARVALGEQPGYNAQPQRVWMPFPTTADQEKCDITKQYGCHSVRVFYGRFLLSSRLFNQFQKY